MYSAWLLVELAWVELDGKLSAKFPAYFQPDSA